MDNDILSTVQSTGASTETARGDNLNTVGVPASNALAEADRPRIRQFKGRFESAGATHDLPPALPAGVASRESRGGAVLDADGFGDHRNAFGIMQIDKRSFYADR